MSKLSLIFTITTVLSVIIASVYILVQYMNLLSKHQERYRQTPIVIEKHFSNNYSKNKNKEIIIDIDVQEVKSAKNVKYLTGE